MDSGLPDSAGSYTPDQPNSGVINNTPSVTLCTQMGCQVEGWWRTAQCVVLHPIIQIRVRSRDGGPPHLYPAASRHLYPSRILSPPLMPFVNAGPCWKTGRGSLLPWFLSDLWSAGVCSRCCGPLLEEHQSLWSGQDTLKGVPYITAFTLFETYALCPKQRIQN